MFEKRKSDFISGMAPLSCKYLELSDQEIRGSINVTFYCTNPAIRGNLTFKTNIIINIIIIKDVIVYVQRVGAKWKII